MNETTRVEAEGSPRNDGWWILARDLYRGRRTIVAIAACVAIASVVISLLLPKSYTASTRVMPPESSGSLGAALLSNLPAGARSLLGGGVSGDYTRYLAILTSRTLLGAAVDEFDLADVYDVADEPDARDQAMGLLEDQTKFYIDAEYDFLRISVTDRSPQRASDLANFLVERLNELNSSLLSQSAGLLRQYAEERYEDAFVRRDSILRRTEEFQTRYGLFDMPAQSEAFFQQIANLSVMLTEAEIQYESLLGQYGESNPQVATARGIVASSRRKYRDALAGSEAVFPVAQDTMPAVAMEYAKLELERVIQVAIIEALTPVLEQARFEEQRESVAVQVIDNAEPPFRKSHPRRAVIVILSTISAGILAMLYVILSAIWKREYPSIAARFAALK
jgi:capsule polysaccharide export protein KpsE/RkpR